jgi:hypothetical protein
MDAKLRKIISKAAGSYFIVTDNSQVATIEAEPKMRLYFINSEKGAVNMLFKFAKGDTIGFTSMFGKGTRLQEKKGNFSISTCLEALTAGPIAVINLRNFDNSVDKTDVIGLNPNTNDTDKQNIAYTSLFNINKFWTPKAKNMPGLLTKDCLLSFGNVGSNDISIIVTLAGDDDVLTLTSQGDSSLKNCTLEIDEYPAIDFEMLLKDTFVNVYVFNNSFNITGISTNKYYGQYFNNDGQIDLANIENLAAIPESGFIKKFTGSLIPSLISETTSAISIDAIINQDYMNYGIISYINDDLFELDNKFLLDVKGIKFFNGTNTKVALTSDTLLSYVVPETLTESAAVYPLTLANQNVVPASRNLITYGCVKIDEQNFEGSFDQGLRVGDYIKGIDNSLVKINMITVLDEAAIIGATTSTYKKVKYTCSGNIDYKVTVTGVDPDEVTTYAVIKENLFTQVGLAIPSDLSGYKPRSAQFTDGTASKQKDILDMMIAPGIVKGIKSTEGIRYVVDCFKSFVEPSYKYQFGQLMVSLDEGNRFVRSIVNEPFVEDLEKSTNPLFKQTPTGIFDWSFLKVGGNTAYSSKLLTKFSAGANMCFFFGPGNIVGSITRPMAGLVSNLFYAKSMDYDVVANATGYVDGISELETPIDDDDRAFCEAFRFNPIIFFNGGNTIFGNNTGQKEDTAQLQIHNSELLAYIKNSLYSLSKSEAFKKGNYDDYLRTETECTAFMTNLALAGAIEASPIVQCNAGNNTPEIAKQKIKLVHIEYTPVNALEKVVFDLTIN